MAQPEGGDLEVRAVATDQKLRGPRLHSLEHVAHHRTRALVHQVDRAHVGVRELLLRRHQAALQQRSKHNVTKEFTWALQYDP